MAMADIDLKDFAVIGLRSEIARLESEPAGLRTKLASLIGGRLDTPAPGLSPEGRARIAEATRKRVKAEKAAAGAPERELARPPMPRHVRRARHRRGLRKSAFR